MSPRRGLDTDTILHTAIIIANKEGLESVTIASLAKELNVKPPSLYNHIQSLNSLKRLIALQGLEKLTQALIQSIHQLKGEEAILSMCSTYVEFARNHPGLYEATLTAPDGQDLELQGAGEKLLGVVMDILSEVGLEGITALHATRSLRSMLHGFVSLEQKGGFGLPLQLNETLSYMVQVFLIGIQSEKRVR